MKKKNGFVSISIIYSFFIVFLLIMLAMLAAYANKRYLNKLMGDNIPGDSICRRGDGFADCIIKTEAYSVDMTEEELYERYLSLVEITDEVEDEPGMYATQDDYTRLTGNNSLYYRGEVDNNYVKFGDYVWRIVRINGDDTVRLIYQGEYKDTDVGESKLDIDETNYDYITSSGTFGSVDQTKYNRSSYDDANCAIQEALYSTTQSIRELYADDSTCNNCHDTCNTEKNNTSCQWWDVGCSWNREREFLRCSRNCTSDSCNGNWLESTNDFIKTGFDDAWAKLEENQEEHGIETCETAGNLNGAHLLHNIGYMNNKEALLYRYDSKYDNQNKSTVQEYIDTWFVNEIDNKNENGVPLNSFLASETIFCGDKNRTKCYKLDADGSRFTQECDSNEDLEDEAGFFDRLASGVDKFYQQSERYYYTGWERVIDYDSASLVCPDSGDIATKDDVNDTKKNNKVLNLNRYNVNNKEKSLLYSNNRLSKGSKYSEKNEASGIPADSFYQSYIKDFNREILKTKSSSKSEVSLNNNYKYITTFEYIGNNDLKYPVGLLSVDEVVYAGLTYDGSKKSYLLDHSKNDDFFWTMTLAYTDYTSTAGSGRMGAHYFAFGKKDDGVNLLGLVNDYPKDGRIAEFITYASRSGDDKEIFVDNNSAGAYMRPVINLNTQIVYCGGEGSEEDPYIIGKRRYDSGGNWIGDYCPNE